MLTPACGNSLVPLLRGQTVWRQEFFAENLFDAQNYLALAVRSPIGNTFATSPAPKKLKIPLSLRGTLDDYNENDIGPGRITNL